MKDQNFEIIAAAQDTGGVDACGEYYDQANVTFTALIDEKHTVSTLFQMVNVPTAVWIDDEGRIVRPPEAAFSKEQIVLGNKIGDDRYIAGLRDWVVNGEQSRFVMSSTKLKQRLRMSPTKLRLADAHFKLASHLHALDDSDGATAHWQAAQKLNPDSWNYHRQQWSFDPQTAGEKWMQKFRALNGKPYYPPLDLPTAE